MTDMCTEIRRVLTRSGASLIGFADLRGFDPEVRSSLPFGISIAVALDPAIVSGITDAPTADYYHEYREVNDRLYRIAEAARNFLEEQGYQALALHPTVGEDEKTLSTPLPHKTVATRAGLGWVGKCALLLTKEHGSAIRLTTVLTNAPLETAIPIDKSRCGNCAACVEACPAGAVTGQNWQAGMLRDSLYKAHACRETARELSSREFGERVSICGRCIVACPWTKKYLARARNR